MGGHLKRAALEREIVATRCGEYRLGSAPFKRSGPTWAAESANGGQRQERKGVLPLSQWLLPSEVGRPELWGSVVEKGVARAPRRKGDKWLRTKLSQEGDG